MTPEQHEVVLEGMWQTIKALHAALTETGRTLELFFDRMPPEHRVRAAEAMDVVNEGLKSCDELVEPMRKIMEGDR